MDKDYYRKYQKYKFKYNQLSGGKICFMSKDKPACEFEGKLENIDSEIYLAENQLEELAIRSEQAQLAFEKTQQTFQPHCVF